MVRCSKSHYVKVDLARKSDGKRFESFEALAEDPNASEAILIEIATGLLHGFKMGNG
jgi:hypothetical protein